MAQSQEQQQETAAPAFPHPPHFYRLYADSADGVAAPLPPLPPQPLGGNFPVFGQILDMEEPLVVPMQGTAVFQRQPDGSIDHVGELSRLNSELLFLFLELLRCLVSNPTMYAPHLNRINQLMGSMHHLINLLRPQQAYATMEYALQLEVQEKEEALARLRAQVESVDRILLNAAQRLVDTAASGGQNHIKEEPMMT